MGGNSSIPPTTMLTRIPPITSNDIFGSNLPFSTPPAVDEGVSNADLYMNSPPATPLPHFIEDDDFPPDSTKDVPEPPQDPSPTDKYPSLHEPEDDDMDQGEPDLEKFMDWEYIKQGHLISAFFLS